MSTKPLSVRLLVTAAALALASMSNAIPVVYVNTATGNDGNAGNAPGAAVKTITKGIELVDADGTVNVAAGSYAEQIVVGKSVKLRGANAGVSPTTGTRTAESIITANAPVILLQPAAASSEVDGFKFTGSANDVDDGIIKAQSGPNNVAIACNVFDANASRAVNAIGVIGWYIHDNLIQNVTGNQESGMSLVTLQDSVVAYNRIVNAVYGGMIVDSTVRTLFTRNYIQNVTQAGIQVANTAGPNTLSFNTMTQTNTSNSADKGAVTVYVNVSNLSILNNDFSGNNGAVAIRNQAGTVAATVVANQNNIVGNNGVAVKNSAQGGGTLDATNNWWGSNTGPTHASNPGGTGDAVSNNVNFTPWLQQVSSVESWATYE